MDFSRLRTGEIVAGIGGIALFVFMFLHWFGGGISVSTGGTQDLPGVGQVPSGPSVNTDVGISAWDALQDFSGFLIALSAVSGVVLAALAVAGQRIRLGGLPRGEVTATLGTLAVLLILWRMLANPGSLKIGIFLGLIAAVTITVGALLALREDGFEPLVAVGGGRAKASSSRSRATRSAPARRASSRSTASRSGGSRSGARKPAGRAKRASAGSRSRSTSRKK